MRNFTDQEFTKVFNAFNTHIIRKNNEYSDQLLESLYTMMILYKETSEHYEKLVGYVPETKVTETVIFRDALALMPENYRQEIFDRSWKSSK